MKKYKLGEHVGRDCAKLRILSNDVELEDYCWNCVEDYKVVKEECEFCNGTRFLLTPSGKAILDLVENHTE